ncbi:MAG: MiaE family protein [Planctomycetota bacterium]|jgi:tRNA-(ms[2]io[6]A)-hydroxylase
MLNLASQTDPEWVERALANLDVILLDHAHCEKKAASTAINLIFRHGDRAELMRPLSEIAREELEHFELMIDVLDRRGTPIRRLTPSPYAARLMKAVRPEEPWKLLDTLLCCALIEARSCERMQLLAENLDDPDLARLYRGLLASEARHHQGYVELATDLGIAPAADVRARLAELAEHEALVIAAAPDDPRLHN